MNSEDSVLTLNKIIELPGMKGRIDHMCADSSFSTIYVAAFGNNSVEVVNLQNGIVIHSINNLDKPQGVAYLSESNQIFVSNGGSGICQFFDATNFALKDQINLGDDADNTRYNEESNVVYAGYGEGAIAVIDASTRKLDGTMQLDGHPESFQFDALTKKLWVNVARLNLVEIIDLKSLSVINKWKNDELEDNFPMAIDYLHHRIFIGCRSTSRLLILNSETGEKITSLEITKDADDIFYDNSSNLLFISCGGGFIDIVKQINADNYNLIGHTPTRLGARTSLYLKKSNQLLLAVPQYNGKPAELRVYDIHVG